MARLHHGAQLVGEPLLPFAHQAQDHPCDVARKTRRHTPPGVMDGDERRGDDDAPSGVLRLLQLVHDRGKVVGGEDLSRGVVEAKRALEDFLCADGARGHPKVGRELIRNELARRCRLVRVPLLLAMEGLKTRKRA